MKSLLWRVGLAGVLLGCVSQARAGQLIVNGGFEAGLAGWTVFDQAGGFGTWFAWGAGATPISGSPSVGPAAGLGYAVSDQGGAGAHALIQAFAVTPGASVALSFDMFVNDYDGGPIVHPSGLDFTSGGSGAPNQHARVDILTAGALPLDTGGGVLGTFYLGVDPGADPNPYTPYAFDITGLVGGGGIFQLRFAEVDNQLFLNQGVDNVSVFETLPGVVPEPASLTLLGMGALSLAGYSWRKRRQAA